MHPAFNQSVSNFGQGINILIAVCFLAQRVKFYQFFTGRKTLANTLR